MIEARTIGMDSGAIVQIGRLGKEYVRVLYNGAAHGASSEY
jgi:hypothetical protein